MLSTLPLKLIWDIKNFEEIQFSFLKKAHMRTLPSTFIPLNLKNLQQGTKYFYILYDSSYSHIQPMKCTSYNGRLFKLQVPEHYAVDKPN